MSNSDLIALISAVIAALSLAANVYVLRTNKVMADSAEKGLMLAHRANEITAKAVDDQIAANERAQAAFVGMQGAVYRGKEAEHPEDGGDMGVLFVNDLTGFVTVTLRNEGAASAFDVQLVATEFADLNLSAFNRVRLADPKSRFASLPWQAHPSLHPRETADLMFAIRNNAADGTPEPILELDFTVAFRDGNGRHRTRCSLLFLGTDREFGPVKGTVLLMPPLQPVSSTRA